MSLEASVVVCFAGFGIVLSGATSNRLLASRAEHFHAASAVPLAVAVPSKDGWWIKVRKAKQESPTITFSIGSNNHTIEAWRTWNSGDDLEFDVPDKFRNINPLYIKAQSSGGRNSWFCMMYRDTGVKHFDFDDDEDHERQQSDPDGECNFSN
jgi:hypothetical protein